MSGSNVVSYWISTSNHNFGLFWSIKSLLYLIEFLHQTTTHQPREQARPLLYLIEFLHQTTTCLCRILRCKRCILLNFYIKPQPANPFRSQIEGCILLNFYIKPQQRKYTDVFCIVVSYWISTSNHNRGHGSSSRCSVVSYWISTSNHNSYLFFIFALLLYLIEFLHQTTTTATHVGNTYRCILLNFYIKPQLRRSS